MTSLLPIVSIGVQLAAGAFALGLARRSRRRARWLLLACAFVLMIVGRGIALAGQFDRIPRLPATVLLEEAVALTSSILLLTAVVAMAGHFRRAQRDQRDAGAWAAAAHRTTAEVALLGERLRSILDAAGEGVMGLDREGKVTFANRAATEILGYSAEALMGQRSHPLIHHTRESGTPYPEEECPIYFTLWHGTSHRSGEEVVWTRSGTSVPIEYVTTPIRNADSVDGAVVVFRDIRERRLAERALKESEATLRHIYEQAPVMIHSVDEAGLICDVNALWLAETGYERDDVIGQPESRFATGRGQAAPCLTVRPEDWEDGRRCEAEAHYLCKDGTTIEVFHHCVATTDPSGLRIHLVVSRNVSEQRVLEEHVRRAQRAEAVGQFASGIAHDFNNLVQVIAGTTELLQVGLPPDDPRQEDLGTIRRVTERATQLTRELSAFSRRQVLQRVDLDLDTLIGGVLPMLRRVIPENISLQFHNSDTPLTAHADPAQVEQILMNLCINARDAMATGGTLKIETGAEILTEENLGARPWAQPGAYVTFSVADTGQGISPENLKHVFDPFFTTKESGRGSGLGLATTYGIVKQHEGMIEVASELGRGTIFRVYLPRGTGSPAALPSVARPAGGSEGGSETLLIVEDQADLCELTARLLRRLGYRVLQATDSRQALDLLSDEGTQADLVITDMIMPDLGGVDLFHLVRERRPALPFIFCSGYADRGIDMDEAFPSDALVSFMPKPYSHDELASKVREVLDQRAADGEEER